MNGQEANRESDVRFSRMFTVNAAAERGGHRL